MPQKLQIDKWLCSATVGLAGLAAVGEHHAQRGEDDEGTAEAGGDARGDPDPPGVLQTGVLGEEGQHRDRGGDLGDAAHARTDGRSWAD